MKKINIFILNILFVLLYTSQTALAQRIGNLEGINYQAVAIDDNGKEIVGIDINGKPLYNKSIGVRFSISKGNNGPVQYQETHTALTDQYGLFSLVIGKGNVGTGEHSKLMDIPWIDADQFLKVEISLKNDGTYKVVSLQKFMSVPYSYYTNDIADDAITTAKILNETIISEDIAVGAVTTEEILDGTILNEDIADGTIDLTSKVTNVLPVANGGTGASSLINGGILLGGGTGAVKALPPATDGQIPVGVTESDPVMKKLTGGTGIQVTFNSDSVIISSMISGSVEADGIQTIDIGIIATGTTYVSPAFPVPGGGSGQMGDIVLASIDKNLQGCILTPYFFSANTIKVAIFNGTGAQVNLGTGVKVKLLIVQ
jgi:hypothetical protein